MKTNKQQEIISNYIRGFTAYDTINVYEDLEDTFMDDIKTGKLLAIIDMNKNKRLDLSKIQPEYTWKHTGILGTGILCYKENAKDILTKRLKQNEKIVRVEIAINKVKPLHIGNYAYSQEIKELYNMVSDEVKKESDSDEKVIDYICKKSKKQYNSVIGFMPIGNPLYRGSSIIEYMDKVILLKTDDLILSAEEV